jgi:4-carboxymuconolactone decarboxylase
VSDPVPDGGDPVPPEWGTGTTLSELDHPTRLLIRLSAVVTAGDEDAVRAELAQAAGTVPAPWVEELLLQTHLFAGFPRALNAMRSWRRLSPEIAVPADANTISDTDDISTAGQRTCSAVYGPMYHRLRGNIAALHPALDAWMIDDGYGKVLSRPALDLPRRELCIVAACAAAGQGRQLHSHLHGSLNVGVAPGVLRQAVDSLGGVVADDRLTAARLLLDRVLEK